MGLSSKKTKSEPWAPAQPFIIKGMENSNRVFDQQQPNLDKFSAMQMDTYGRLAPGAEQGVMGAQSLVNDTLSGKYLNSNPYMDAMATTARNNAADEIASRYSGAGRYGSGAGQAAMTKAMMEAENALRYQGYNMERGYQNNAVQQAQALMGGATGLLNNAADLPWLGVGALNGNIRQASNGYGVTKTGGGFLGDLALSAAGNAGSFLKGG